MSDQLQIQNRFGVFRSDRDLKNMKPIKEFPSFTGGSEIQSGKVNPVCASPDGKYLLSLRPKTHSFADLILFDIENGKEITISGGIELTYQGPGAAWSPDSRFFVYAKEGLYYYSIE